MKRMLPKAALTALIFSPLPAVAQKVVYACDGPNGIYASDQRVSGGKCKGAYVEAPPRWVFVTRSAAGDEVRADTQTIARDGSRISAWVQTFHLDQPRYMGPQGEATRTLQRETLDCMNAVVSYGATISYNEAGRVVYSDSAPPTDWSPIPPDTVVEAVWQFLCKP